MGPQKAQCCVVPSKPLYLVLSKDQSCSVNSHNEPELQVRAGTDWKSQLQTPPPMKFPDSALPTSPVTTLHRDSRAPQGTAKKIRVFGVGGFMGKGKDTEKVTQVSRAWFCTLFAY